MSVSLFLAEWLRCVRHGDTILAGRLLAVFDLVLGGVVMRCGFVGRQPSLILSDA